MLYVDIPSPAQLLALVEQRADACVSIYLATTPLTQDVGKDRIELKNLAREAIGQLEAANADKRRLAAISEHIDDLVDDDGFWRFQAHSLAVFATPDRLVTYRLPNALEPEVEVADRFYVKPLLRAVAFPNAAHVLALAEGSVRLVEVSADRPAVTVKVEGMPKDAGSAVGRSGVNDRSPSGRIQGSEGQKVLLRMYARQVDAAIRGALPGSDLPLILAAAEPLAAIYRSVNTHPKLAAQTIEGSPETLSDAELADRARKVMDRVYADEIAAWGRLYEKRGGDGRATADVAQAARAATYGAVESLLVDIDRKVPGSVDDDGKVTFAQSDDARSYGVVDEIAGRVLLSGGRVLAVRAADIPGGAPLAAVLRYAV